MSLMGTYAPRQLRASAEQPVRDAKPKVGHIAGSGLYAAQNVGGVGQEA